MIERERKRDPDDEENRQRDSLVNPGEQQTGKVDHENQDFGSDYVRHDRADKKAFFAFEVHATTGATVFQVERSFDDGRITTSGTLQLQTTTQREGDRAGISFHGLVDQDRAVPAAAPLRCAGTECLKLRRSDIFIVTSRQLRS